MVNVGTKLAHRNRMMASSMFSYHRRGRMLVSPQLLYRNGYDFVRLSVQVALLSPGLDAIFQRYTGFSAHDTALVDKQKASGRFIPSESLTKMQEAEREANAESNGSSRSMGGEERAATANESAANCASSNGVGSTPRSASTNNPAPNNCTARKKRVCIGLNKYRIGEFVDSNKDDAQYCHAQGWTFFRSAWRAGDCRIDDQSNGKFIK